MTTIGLASPGEMGAAVAAMAGQAGHEVVWSTDGRSPETHRRADAAGLRGVPDLAEVCEQAAVMLSICPPHAAIATATDVMATGFSGIYVDGNAIAPATARTIQEVVASAASFVDAGIIGPAPVKAGTTRMYFAGPDAGSVAAMLDGGPLEPIVLADAAPSASALKIAYASWTKGSRALMLAVRAYASAEGTEAALLREWAISLPDMKKETQAVAAGVSHKAWRWVAEMEEISAAYTAVGLPGEFHRGAADVYTGLKDRKNVKGTTIDEAISDLLAPR